MASPDLTKRAISAAEDYLVELERLACNLGPTIGLEAFDERRGRLAEEVFGIPELLEHICLSGLSVFDLLHAQQVSKAFLAGILTSPKLLRRMGLRADVGASYSSAFAKGETRSNGFQSFRAELVDHSEPRYLISGTREPRLSVRLTAYFWSEAKTKTLPKLGSRPRDMLVCQPPVDEVTARIDCCNKTSTVRSAAGIRVGDLYDAALSLSETHRLCPLVHFNRHDEEGNFNAAVRFSGEIPLSKKDKAMLRKMSEAADSGDSSDELPDPMFDGVDKGKRVAARKPQEDLREYVHAKYAAYQDRQTIPTLAQYLDKKYNKPKTQPGTSKTQRSVVKSTGGGEISAKRSTRLMAKKAGS
ncbi:hypothetical protein LTR85_011351 [Meristemomyces frigidus]|nr:hypothetical protein LTR85_011351 [Meristemomyces frigidus]